MKTAVILAAGEGKRLRPLTFTRPKCMIELAGKPILAHVLDNLKKAGIKETVLVVKYMSDVVREYFGDGKKFGMKIEYVEQGERYGTAAAFETAREHIDDSFLGIAADIITDAEAIKSVIKAHDGIATLGLKNVEHVSEYGIATLKAGKVSNFEEKPKTSASKLANASIYAFDSKVFDEISKLKPSPRGEYEITDVIKNLIPKREASGVEISGYWLDMGMPWHLFDANKYLIEKTPAKKGAIENSTISGKVIMEEGARIYDSYIEGPLYLGKKSEIGPHAYIRGCTSIGDFCHIGDSTTVKNSIIFHGVNAKHLSYIGDSIVGSNCNFGAGTQIANYRFDEGMITAKISGAEMDTRRRKLGAVIGDKTKTGVLSCIMPGKTIGDECWIGAGVVVKDNIPRKTGVFVKQDLVFFNREQKKGESV
ncbi:MAG: bifunctional sugar-1-phosphate nucleotidylyltransferase/acetyltransferase [Candidatus Micrarchaeota archaeon]